MTQPAFFSLLKLLLSGNAVVVFGGSTGRGASTVRRPVLLHEPVPLIQRVLHAVGRAKGPKFWVHRKCRARSAKFWMSANTRTLVSAPFHKFLVPY